MYGCLTVSAFAYHLPHTHTERHTPTQRGRQTVWERDGANYCIFMGPVGNLARMAGHRNVARGRAGQLGLIYIINFEYFIVCLGKDTAAGKADRECCCLPGSVCVGVHDQAAATTAS